jgi:hypothetical protein
MLPAVLWIANEWPVASTLKMIVSPVRAVTVGLEPVKLPVTSHAVTVDAATPRM